MKGAAPGTCSGLRSPTPLPGTGASAAADPIEAPPETAGGASSMPGV